jgi:hypothetical protein
LQPKDYGDVNPRFFIACMIFAGSYLPLSLILLAQNLDFDNWQCSSVGFLLPFVRWRLPLRNPAFSLGIFAGCLLCFILTLPALARVQTKTEIVIRRAEYVPTDLMNYVLPYVVSFMSIDYQETGKFVGFLIFLGWMFWIIYKAGQIIMNPVLTVLGWRLYKIAYTFPGNPREYGGVAITKSVLLPGERYRHGAIQDVLVLR